MIRYYLNEEPILKNIPTYPLALEENRKMVFGQYGEHGVQKNKSIGWIWNADRKQRH
jgi:uncharacterized circularly permuted ATP-grasp superfamily protein